MTPRDKVMKEYLALEVDAAGKYQDGGSRAAIVGENARPSKSGFGGSAGPAENAATRSEGTAAARRWSGNSRRCGSGMGGTSLMMSAVSPPWRPQSSRSEQRTKKRTRYLSRTGVIVEEIHCWRGCWQARGGEYRGGDRSGS